MTPARRLFAHPLGGDPAIASGPSGCAGLAGLTRVCADKSAFEALKLGKRSRVLLDQQRRQPRGATGMNRLSAETSPYLLQHANNPVHWWAWGEAALAEAKRTNRPILLSVGYAACHWCHVMAHESFESPEVAAVMNELFVNIKVDREERPDVDAIYMQALQILGEPGGWPLTMFCTSDGEPFWGGTYFPYPARYGRPSFVDVLHGVAQAFHDKPQDIETNRAGLLKALQQKAANKAIEIKGEGPLIPLALLDRIAARLAEECDPVWGGFGQAPKFPSPYLFETIWRGGTARSHQRPSVRRRHRHARPHVPGRHLRSPGRRLRALRHRCRVADPALREDALRQRAARRPADPGLAGDQEPALRRRASPRPATGSCARWWPRAAASPRPTMPTARASKASSMCGTKPRSTRSSGPTMRPSSSRSTTSRPAATGSTTPSCTATGHRPCWARTKSGGWRACAPS